MALDSVAMECRLGLVLMSLVFALGCKQETPQTNGQSTGGANVDAAAGGAGVGGSGGSGAVSGVVDAASSGGVASVDGSFVTGGATSSSSGGSAIGGASTSAGGTIATGGVTSGGGQSGNTVLGGTSTVLGGSATAGTALGGGGGASVGGQVGSTSPVDDSPGQNPFARPAGSGILITSSDGLNSTELLLAADAKDGMFVAGATRSSQAMGLTAFDPGVVSEAFAARLDAGGRLVWSVPLKTCGVPADIAAGPDDSVFVLCPYEPDTTTLMPSICEATASVEKLSGADGKVLFEARIKMPAAAPTDGYLCPYGLGVDAQGRSYVGAGYSPKVQSTRALLTAVTADGQQDWTLISEGPDGNPQSDSAVAYVTDVDVDSKGDVLFVGSFNTWMKLGTTQLTSQAVMDQYSMYNGFFARVPTTGSGPTAWRFGGLVFDLATSLAPTGDGGFVLGGWASASSNIGGKTVAASQAGSAFVARITAQGQATWAKAIPGDGIADGVAVGADGKAYVVGQFANDEILYTYDPTADTLTAHKTVVGNATDNGIRTHSVALSTSGAVWLSGTFKGTINLGTGALTTSTVAAFLIKLN